MPPVSPKLKPKVSAETLSPPHPHVRWILLLGVLVVAVYANSVGADLAFDNRALIQQDARLHGAAWTNVKAIFSTNYWWPRPSADYRPFTLLTYIFNYAVLGGGTDPAGYHLINILLHWLNAVLVYLLMLAIWAEVLPAVLAAAVFAAHPAATESVTNIVGRADLLATASVLGGLLVYLRAVRTPARRGRWLAALAGIATVGAFSKENASALPAVLLLYDLTWRVENLHSSWAVNLWRNAWRWFRQGYWAAIAPFVLFWTVRTAVFANLPTPWVPFLDNPLVRAGFWTARATAVKVFGKYLGLMAWPATLSCDYSYNQIPLVDWSMRRPQDWLALASLAVILLLITVALRSYRRRKDVFFFIGFIFLTLAPLSNLFFLVGTIMAERFLYLPLVGFAGLVVVAVRAAAERLLPGKASRAVYAVFAILLLACSVRTVVRNRDWADEATVFRRAVETSPASYKVHSNYASALSHADLRGNLERILAEAELARAIAGNLRPEDYDIDLLANLGLFYRAKGDTMADRDSNGYLFQNPASAPWYEKSAAAFIQASAATDSLSARVARSSRAADRAAAFVRPDVLSGLAETRLRQRRFDDARKALERAIAVAPDRPDPYAQIATVDFQTQRPEDGLTALHAALILKPDHAAALTFLRNVYRAVDPQGCAVTADVTATRSACAPVREYRCRGYASLVRNLRAGRSAALGARLRAAAQAAGCPLP